MHIFSVITVRNVLRPNFSVRMLVYVLFLDLLLSSTC